MLNSLITSKTRLKLLMKFFINSGTTSYLRELATEFGESTNSIRLELNRLTAAKLLSSENAGRTVQYQANKKHSLFNEINSLVKKYIGIDKIIDKLVKRIGFVDAAYLIGDYSRGIDSGLIDLVLVGEININVLHEISDKRGAEINRKIRYLVLTNKELLELWSQLGMDQALLIWGNPIKNT